ncbi:MAG: hypothetical protein H7331_07745 [Bacteroidia bacterium]|nr:hypothetical protein [Bacteroidia bacterium]
MKTILILGSGFIGLPLAQSLQLDNYNVTLTTTQQLKVDQLQALGLQAVCFNGDITKDYDQFSNLSFDYVIYALPPSACKYSGYTQVLSMILNKLSYVGAVLFTSSISVYLNNNATHNEQSTALASAENVIITTENYIRKQYANHYILRLAGLIGNTRHPKNFFKNGVLENSNAPVNMVCGPDVVELIKQTINTPLSYGTYNVCAPQHPTKASYYKNYTPTLCCKQGNEGKEIDGNLIANKLGYTYSSIWLD